MRDGSVNKENDPVEHHRLICPGLIRKNDAHATQQPFSSMNVKYCMCACDVNSLGFVFELDLEDQGFMIGAIREFDRTWSGA